MNIISAQEVAAILGLDIMLSAETGLSIKEIFWLGVDRAEKEKDKK